MTTNEPPPSSGEPTPPTPPTPPSYGSAPQLPSYPSQEGAPPPPGYYPPNAPGGYGPPQSNKKAMWSMILGIISLLCCGIITGPVAIFLSSAAKKEIAASGGVQGGAGQAKAGLILGIIGIVGWLAYIVLVLSTGGFEFSTSTSS